MSNLIETWNERIAFNEGYEAQKIKEANLAGRQAFSAGEDKSSSRSVYLSRDDNLSDDISPGIETLGMESIVDDMSLSDDDPDLGDSCEHSQDFYFVAHSMNKAIDDGRYEEVDAFGGFDYDDDGN